MKEKLVTNRTSFFLAFMIALQMAGAIVMALYTSAGGDPIFTFTLANSPYSFNYIDSKIDQFPGENGWFDAYILKEQYTVAEYDAFNYAGLYWHQRIDNHPLLYYFLVHTICSFFPGTYSILYALVINLVCLFLIDLLLIRISDFLFGDRKWSFVTLSAATSMVIFYGFVRQARMYLLLALMCLWFLYICLRILHIGQEGYRSMPVNPQKKQSEKGLLTELFICSLLGSQTHYYFFIYAALLAAGTALFLILDRSFGRFIRCALSVLMAACVSLIIFPWVIWHIVFNQMEKNESLHLWSKDEFLSFLSFLNQYVFNNRFALFAAVCLVVCFFKIFQKKRSLQPAANTESVPKTNNSQARGKEEKTFVYRKRVWSLIFLSALVYAVLIYTLNGGVTHYEMPLYLPAALCISGVLIAAGRTFTKSQYKQLAISLILTFLVMASISNIRDCISTALTSHASYKKMHVVAQEYAGADCIYVANTDDNLFESLWFEFGEYDEFKKIYQDEYLAVLEEEDWDELLGGRNSENTVILYVSDSLDVPANGQILAESNGFRAILLGEL